MSIKRGDLYWVQLDPALGSEQSGHRPVLIIQNDVGNRFSPTTIIAPLTTRDYNKEYPTHVHVVKGSAGLKADSVILLSQIRTIDKSRLGKKIGCLPFSVIDKVDRAIKNSLALK